MRKIICWNTLPRKVVDSPTQDALKIYLDMVWAISSRLCFYQERLDHKILEVPPNLVFYNFQLMMDLGLMVPK